MCSSSLLLCLLQIKHKALESFWHLLPVSIGGRSLCSSIYFSVIKIDTWRNRFDQCRNWDSIMLTCHSYFTFTGYSESIDMGAQSQDSTCLKHHTRLCCMDQSENLKSKWTSYIPFSYGQVVFPMSTQLWCYINKMTLCVAWQKKKFLCNIHIGKSVCNIFPPFEGF